MRAFARGTGGRIGSWAASTSRPASGGAVAGFGFEMLAVLWIGTSLGAWRAAVRRRFEVHRLLMRLSYALTFGAVTLRLQIPIGFMLGYPNYPAMSVWLAYTSWIPNVLVVGLYSIWLERLRHRGGALAVRA